MSNEYMTSIQIAKAKNRANRRYPKQPERARKMAHLELGISDAPYQLEPLTLVQRLETIFGADHIIDFSDLPITTTDRQRSLRLLRFLFTGK